MRKHIRSSILKFSITLLLALFAAVTTTGFGRMARSNNYDLEYSAIGAGSGSAQSANQDYSITGFVIADGLMNAVTGSSDYEVTPLIGGSTDDNASISCWALY